MKLKNINIIEQHVEKGILALCVLAAGYLGYSALTSPLTFDDGGNTVDVKLVEGKITDSVDKLKVEREKNAAAARGWNNVFLNGGGGVANQTGLPLDLVKLNFAPFTPVAHLDGTKGPDQPGPLAKPHTVLPPISPFKLEAKSTGDRIVKTVNMAAGLNGGNPAVAATSPSVVDAKYVKIEASFDPKKQWDTLRGAGIDAGHLPLDPSLTTRVVYLRVKLERKEVFPDDPTRESSWVPITPPPTEAWPALDFTTDDALAKSLDVVHAARGIILQPRYYPVTTEPLTGSKAPATAPVTPVTPVPPTKPPGTGGRPTVSPGTTGTPQPGTGTPPGAMGGAPGAPSATAPGVPAGPQEIKDDMSDAKIRSYDDTAEPGHTYKYHMRVVIYNPAYNDGDTLEPAHLKTDQELVSAWSEDSNPVTIDANQYLFAATDGTFWTYQWSDGKWVPSNISAKVGEPIMAMDAQKQAVDTGYVLVDLRTDKKNVTTSVVLMNVKDGKLVIRDAQSDEGSRRNRFPGG